jgi:hypothetical protein
VATITKKVDRGVPAGKRYQYFGSGERNDNGDYISAGDIFMLEDSLGKPARYVYIETDASCDVEIRINSQYSIYPLRAARVNEPRHPDLENPITMTDTSMEAFPVGANIMGIGKSRTLAGNEKITITNEGGWAIRLVNKTGSASVKGTLVKNGSGADSSFVLTASDDTEIIGAVYENDIADGNECWVVVGGIVEVLLKDSTDATRGYWAGTSDTAGRADCTTASAPGVVLTHFQEIGHCIETKSGGTDVLAKIVMHFN